MIPQSPLDTPENHYRRGIVLLNNGDLVSAQSEFERAGALDKTYPGVHAGSALISMLREDFWRARKQAQKAIQEQRDFVDGYIALGRIVVAEGLARSYPIDDWLEEAVAVYNKALKRDSEHSGIHYWRGQAYLSALRLADARNCMTRVLDLNEGDWIALAMADIERIQMVERAAPGSRFGIKIGLVSAISRAELAVVLLEELKLNELMRQRGRLVPTASTSDPETAAPRDVKQSWAGPWIKQILSMRLGGLSVFPDSTFRPDQKITRANYALVNQSIFVLISGEADLASRYFGEPSRFPDVASDNFAYNAIALSTERGVMAADKITGRFHPQDTVSGAEALLTVRELQNVLRMEF